MMRRLAHCLAVIGVVSLLTTLVGLVAAERADAQGSEKGPGNPTILDAVRALQGSVNTLQTSVNTLQTTVNGLVTNGVNAKPRHFYLTKATHQGNTALSACDPGFHMASLWEIFDPSNLQYDTALGATTGDSGQGPPTNNLGWTRTGFDANIGTIAGEANCSAWTSNSASANGSFAGLIFNEWFFQAGTRTDPWFGSTAPCNFAKPVWCAEDPK